MTEEQKARMPHLFKPGQSGNPSGVSSATARGIQANARRATELRSKFLQTLESRIATIEVLAAEEAAGDLRQEDKLKQQRIMDLLGPDVNRLLTDSENRGYGAPKQAVDIDDRRERRIEDMTDEELEAIAMGEDSGEDEQG